MLLFILHRHILQTSNGITTSFNRHTPHKDFDGIIIQHTPHKQILKTKIGQVSVDRMLRANRTILFGLVREVFYIIPQF